MEGIKILQSLNFKNIKVNAVLLKGVNDTYEEFEKFGDFIKNNKIDFRFIELMQTGDNLDFFKKNHVSSKIFKDYLEKNKWVYQTYGKDAGPSLNYIHPEYKGKFGLIAPYSKDFCKTCNRLRIYRFAGRPIRLWPARPAGRPRPPRPCLPLPPPRPASIRFDLFRAAGVA